MSEDKIQINRDRFIPWILEDHDQEDITAAWSSGVSIEDFALGIAGLIPVQHIKNWEEIKHHFDLDNEKYPCIHEGFEKWSAYYEDDGYVEGIPDTLKVEWVNENSDS
tara:strand:+ start:79 stop:402 length:324 start_codon:yes stop_codon:yes gene_type:complete